LTAPHSPLDIWKLGAAPRFVDQMMALALTA
jgi:hypothetical protein